MNKLNFDEIVLVKFPYTDGKTFRRSHCKFFYQQSIFRYF